MLHKVKLNLTDSIQFKPSKEETGLLNNRITETKEVSIKDLSTLITQPHARIFTPHHFEGSRTKENWLSQSIFYLDFDNGTDLSDILERLREFNIKPNIIYNTLSDSVVKRKYRVIFFLDYLTKDFDTALWIQTNLVEMFPDSDQKCKTVERMVYPGFSVIHLDEEENSVINLLRVINTNIIGKDHNKTRKAKSIELTDECFTLIFDGNFITNSKSDIEKAPEVIQMKAEKFKQLINSVKILSDFNSGMKLGHMEILGLATNLQYIKGGLNYMKNVMLLVNKNGGKRRDGTSKNYDNSEFGILTYIRSKKYLPQMLSNFSPHKEDHELHNLLGVEKWKRGRIDILEVPKKIQLTKAETIFKNEFLKVVKRINKEQDDLFTADTTPDYIKSVNVFKVPTGLGKTKQLETVGNCVIAFPTNKLKNEVSDRMLVEHYVTPDYPEFSDVRINNIIQNYINSNLYTESSKIVTRISNGFEIKIDKFIFTPTENDILLAKNYKENNDLCRTTNKTVLTTHTRAIFDNNFKHDTIIFDECPLNHMVEMGSCSLDFTIFDNTEFKSSVEPIENWLRSKLGFGYIESMPKFTISNYSKFAEFCAMNGRPDLIRLLDSNFIYKDDTNKRNLGDIFFVKKKDIPAKNIIIMSATAPIEIYKYIFGDKLNVIDILNVEKEGKITQYTSKSWSRSSFLKASSSSLQELKEQIGDRPVITFTSFKKIFSKADKHMHFGNVSGYDYLKGQDIAVVGTDNKPLYVYFFYAKIIGMDLKGSDNLLDTRIIEWGGFRFKAMTFENTILRDIQLSLIESELIQAVGRNRNLRENCETILFSSQPLKISDKFIW